MQAHKNILQKRSTALRSASALQLVGKNAQPITDNRKQNPLQLVKNIPAPGVIQRVLDASGVSQTLDKPTMGKYRERAQQLAALVQSYNDTHDESANTQEALHGQKKKLDAVERKAHELLGETALPKTARQELFDLLDSAQEEHVALTGRTLKAKVPLWMPDGTSFMDNEEAQGLWKSLTGQNKSKGNIRLETKNEEFKKQTYANYAQLLRGKVGRSLLKDLNKVGKKKSKRGIDKRVYITDDAQDNFGHTGATLDKDGSYAEPYSRAHKNPIDLFTEQPGKKANKGTGAYVQIDKKEEDAVTDFDSRLTGESGEALYTPSYITLGHELGHAQAHLHGRTQSTFKDTTTLESTIWSNPEEQRNITGVENPLRSEHGISKRKYHYTKGSARAAKFKRQFDEEVVAIWGLVPMPLRNRVKNEIEDFGNLSNQITNHIDFEKPGNVKAMKNRLIKLRHDVQTFVNNPPPPPQPIQHGGQQQQQQQPGFFRGLWKAVTGY